MSIKRLLSTIDKANLVPMIKQRKDGEQTLVSLGKRVLQNHNDNDTSMGEWAQLIKDGMDVAKLEAKGASYPWDGAANYKSPLITEAVRQFGDRAKTEIMSSDKLVACKVDGVESEAASASCNRVEKHMNWQINSELRTWRQAHTRSLYTLAGCGAFFKKTYFDATQGCNQSRVIKYPNFSLHQECSHLEDSNFTEILYYYPNDVWERKAAKLWDVPDELIPDLDNDNEDEDKYCFLEQFMCFDLDGDGYEEPLIVTIHKQSETVVRIVARYEVDGLHVYFQGNTYNLQDLIKARAVPPTDNNDEFNRAYIRKQLEEIERDSQLVRIVPDDILTYYGFIEPTDGSFLSWGYLHILASVVKGVNKTTNALLNAGELANLQGGWLSKEHRDRNSGEFSVKPGYFKQTNISAQNLANSVNPLPFKEPSQVLLALNQEIKAEIQTLSARFNADDAMKSGVSAASVLGALQEGVIPTSSLIMNVVNAMSHEFSVMYKLNARYTEPLIYQSLTGTPDFEADYGQEIGIKPTANAMFSNQMQRITLAQAQMDQMESFLQIGGNPVPIVKGYYEALGTANMQELFPEQMTSEEEAQRQRMLETQEAQLKALQEQNRMMQQQMQLLKTDTDRRVFEAQAKAQKDQAELQLKLQQQQIDAQINAQKLQAETQKAEQQLQIKGFELQKAISEDEASNNMDVAKLQLEQQRITGEQEKQAQDFALRLTKLEQDYAKQLNDEIKDNAALIQQDRQE